MNQFFEIEKYKDILTQNEYILAKYIQNNLDRIGNMTVKSIAKESNSSPATLVRLSKKLGYSGFKQMKISLVKHYTKDLDDNMYEILSIDDNTQTTIDKICLENINAIKNTSILLNTSTIESATEMMKNAKSIHLFGIGSSYIVALDLLYKLIRINVPAYLYSDYHLQLVSASNMSNGDVAIAISNSGKTKETYNSLKLAKDRGASTISITRLGKNPISDLSDINISTVDIEQGLRVGAIASRIAQLTVIDILFMCYTQKVYKTIPKYINETGHLISDMKL